jgi:hypothetical protein
MLLVHKVSQGDRQKQRIVDLPGAKGFAHAPEKV